MSYQLPIPGAYRAAPTVRPDRTAIGARPAGVRGLRRTRCWLSLSGPQSLSINGDLAERLAPVGSQYRLAWPLAGRYTTNPLLALSVGPLVPPMQREAGRCVVPDRWS